MTNPSDSASSDEMLAQARAAKRAGALPQAAQAYEAYLAEHPSDQAVTYEASEVLRQIGDTAGIAALFSRASNAAPDEPFLKSSYIEAVLNLQQAEKALELAEEAISGDPGHSGFHALKGLSLQALGCLDEARAAFWAAHEADPKNMHALSNLEALENGADRDRLLAALEDAWESRDALPSMDRIALGFARGKALEKAGAFDEAFAAYAEGAKLQRGRVPFNEPAAVAVDDNHMRLFTPARLKTALLPAGTGSDIVFVVGLPRSGSTLIEQILSSHEDAAGIGERDFVMRAFDGWWQAGQGNPVKLFTEAALRKAGESYRAMAEEIAGADKVIIDKTLGNTAYLGFLNLVFPGAKIIYAARAPMDTAFSCFTTLFYFGLEWTYDLGELGRAVRRHQKLMGYWMRNLAAPIHFCRYEALLANPEDEARALLKAADLSWDARVLDFHKTDRAVATASVTQVRQPLYKTAQGRAGKFGAHLNTLEKALGRAATPDWFTK